MNNDILEKRDEGVCDFYIIENDTLSYKGRYNFLIVGNKTKNHFSLTFKDCLSNFTYHNTTCPWYCIREDGTIIFDFNTGLKYELRNIRSRYTYSNSDLFDYCYT